MSFICALLRIYAIGIVSVSYLNSQHHKTQQISTPNSTLYECKVLKNPNITFCLITLFFSHFSSVIFECVDEITCFE